MTGFGFLLNSVPDSEGAYGSVSRNDPPGQGSDMIPAHEHCAGADKGGPQSQCARQASLQPVPHTNPDVLQPP